jgi:hypothetical protein
LSCDADVCDCPVIYLQEYHDLVSAKRVETLGAMGGRRRQLAPVSRAAVVVEDDLAIEVFEVRHVNRRG